MIVFNIQCDSEKEMTELRGQMCYALKGSPAFINSEIAVCDNDNTSFLLVVGHSNERDVDYTIEQKSIKETWRK